MASAAETVVLLPGLWVNARILGLMRRRIARCGYRAVSFPYASMRATLDENADRLAAYCEALSCERFHLVGHSLGGLVVLHALERAALPRLGRIVLLGTPFAGSYAARRLAALPGGRMLLGRSMPQWLDGPRPQAGDRCEIGVIAGDLGIGLGRAIAPGLAKPNDGVVSLSETAVPGMRERIVLHVSHTAMMFAASVPRQICAFIGNGRFRHAEEDD